MAARHLSTVYDSEIDALVSRLSSVGGLCETQIRRAAQAIASLDLGRADEVLQDEERLNALELELDRALTGVLARRQPAAGDLRLLLAISKTMTNLERIGDEAVKVARATHLLVARRAPPQRLPLAEVRFGAELAGVSLRRSLDAFARMEVASAVAVLKGDHALDLWFDGFAAQLADLLSREPALAAEGLRLLLAGKAAERMGDHAKNIAELVIYVARGEDVRHMAPVEVEALVP